MLCRKKECSIRGEEEEHRRACRIERDDGRRGEKEKIGRDRDGKIERERKRERKVGMEKRKGGQEKHGVRDDVPNSLCRVRARVMHAS